MHAKSTQKSLIQQFKGFFSIQVHPNNFIHEMFCIIFFFVYHGSIKTMLTKVLAFLSPISTYSKPVKKVNQINEIHCGVIYVKNVTEIKGSQL